MDLLVLSLVELYVAFAILVLVPLGLGLAETDRESDGHFGAFVLTIGFQFPAAIAALIALSLPTGSFFAVLLVLPWIGVTMTAGVFGGWRFWSRGFLPLPELAIDAALLYLPVGAVALLLHVAGVSLQFRPIIILLTAAHYHYAGFVLPLVTGLAARQLVDDETGGSGSRPFHQIRDIAIVVIIANIALIAVGITFSPIVEVIAVTLFTVAVAVFAGVLLIRLVPTLPPIQASLVSVAGITIVLTMALALAYGYSAFPTTGKIVSISTMVTWHGTLNIFGFSLPMVLAFRLLIVQPGVSSS
jgi:hypothetical protein